MPCALAALAMTSQFSMALWTPLPSALPVARTILSCSMSHTFSKNLFIPEANLSTISRAGFLLAKREAHILGNWIPIIKLYYNVVVLLNNLRSHYWLTNSVYEIKLLTYH